MFGRAGRQRRRRRPGLRRRGLRRLLATSSTPSSAGRTGGTARRGAAADRLRPPLRPPDHVRRGRARDGEGDRVPGPRPVRHLQRHRREARHRRRSSARSARAAARSGSIRQTMLGQMVSAAPARAAAARARIVETPCETCRGEGRTERRRSSGSRSPAGIDEGHQIRLSNEGEVGPARRGRRAASTSRSTSPTHPELTREGTELYYEADAVDRPGRARDEDPRSRPSRATTPRSRSSRAPSRARRSASAAGACRTSAGRRRAATST